MHSEILHSLPNKRYVWNDKQKTKLMINVQCDAVYYSCRKWNWLIFLDENINKMSYIMLWCSGTILEIENMEQSLFYKLISDPSFVTRTILKKKLIQYVLWKNLLKFNYSEVQLCTNEQFTRLWTYYELYRQIPLELSKWNKTVYFSWNCFQTLNRNNLIIWWTLHY